MKTPSTQTYIASLTLAALVFAVPAPAVAQTQEDTIVYALQSDMQNWDPPNSVQREAIVLGYHVFDHLAVRDLPSGGIVPHLATSWKAVDDTTWEVMLRRGVRFHDGSGFTARDVKATFDRVLDEKNKLWARATHVKIKSVEIVDDVTVRFTTDGPHPLFVERLTGLVMQSEKVIREKGHEWMQENPIGTGPYKLLKWTRKQEHLLVRNDDYWGRKPAFKYVRVRIIPDAATQIAELISGGVDVVRYVAPDQMDVVNNSGTARTSTARIIRTDMTQLDQAARSGPNPFVDRRVRQAANLAVDSDAIIKHVLKGLADRTATVINPLAFGFDPALKPYKQDVDRAKKLLAEAGYPNGFDVRLLTAPRVGASQQVGNAIATDLAKVGIRTQESNIAEVGPYVNLVRDGKAGPMFRWSWGYGSIFDADAILYDVLKCGELYSYYCNRQLDDLIIQGRSTLDQRRRAEVYSKAQKLIFEDAAYHFTWGLRATWGVSNRVDYEAPKDEIDRMFLATPRRN